MVQKTHKVKERAHGLITINILLSLADFKRKSSKLSEKGERG